MSDTTHPTVSPPPDTFNFAQHILSLNDGRPEKVAFIDDHGVLTYGELADKVRRTAGALLAMGLMPEQRVLLLMHDTNDWPVSFLGAMYAGLVPVAVNTLLTVEDYTYMLQHSRARAAMVSAALLPVYREAVAASGAEIIQTWVAGESDLEGEKEVSLAASLMGAEPMAEAAITCGDDIGFWLYSSGSTGRPKGAVHTHANPYWTSELYGRHLLQLKEDDICFSAAKLFFAYGLGNGLTFPMSVGATTVLLAGRPTPDAVFERWVKHKPTVFFGAPTGYAGMLASPNLPAKEQVALRLCSSAGEALPAELGNRFSEHYGVEIVDGIGSTEMLHIFLSNRPGQVQYGTTGWPVPGYEVELRNESGQPVQDGEVGDLFIQGPSAALMYWNNRDKSRETFQGAWTKSGDKYVKNADGTYTYAGRSDDMLKVSGIYVSPFEVEGTLLQHPAVLEAAVIGVNDENGLTRAKAFVVLKDGQSTTSAELQAFVKERLAPYKYPRLIEFLDELPKTATGKIQRFKLRALEQNT